MRSDILALQRRVGVTSLYVTHDQAEAMTLGDRIAVLNGGRLQQLGTPEEVFRRPRNLFVAAFMGTPTINLLRGAVAEGVLRAGMLEVGVGGAAGVSDGPVILGFRPESLLPAAEAPGLPRLEMHGRPRRGARQRDARLRQRAGRDRLGRHRPAPAAAAAGLEGPRRRASPGLQRRRPRRDAAARLSTRTRVYLFEAATGEALGDAPAAG